MKKSVLLFALVLILLTDLIVSKHISASQTLPTPDANYVPNEVLVKFFENTAETSSLRGVIAQVQGTVINYHKHPIESTEWDTAVLSTRSFVSFPELVRLRVPEGLGTDWAVSVLRDNPLVEWAEPNGIVRATTTPNDTYFSTLWGLYNTTQSGGTSRADIHAPEAWDIVTDSPDVVVAVIDTGIAYTHPDLNDNIWINSEEYGSGKETNGIDDDDNGYIDDWHGWDFVNDDNDPMDDDSTDNVYHGTHVAGIIGAEGNNNYGVTGVTWDVQLMPLKVLDDEGFGTYADIISAIDYLVAKAVPISNNSYGGTTYNSSLLYAIQAARSAGHLFGAAAGNSGINCDGTEKEYPAAYNLDNIVSVLATTDDDTKPNWSNYGATTVDIGAPGGEDGTQSNYNINSTKPGPDYQYHDGTSMATPYVTGTAALALARIPGLTYIQIKTRIIDDADYKAALNGKCVASGRLNAYNVVYDADVPDGTPDGLAITWYSWESASLTWNDNSSDEIGFNVERQRSGEQQYSTIDSLNKNVASCLDTTLAGGTNYYRVKAFNMAGDSTSNPLTATVAAGVPSAPSDLAAESPTLVHHVVLTWTDNATNEQVFVVQRRLSGGGTWTNVGTVDADPYEQYPSMTWTDTGVNQGNYYYRVKATNPNGSSSYSSELYVEVEQI